MRNVAVCNNTHELRKTAKSEVHSINGRRTRQEHSLVHHTYWFSYKILSKWLMKQFAASTGVFTLKIVQYNNTKTILQPHYNPKTTPKKQYGGRVLLQYCACAVTCRHQRWRNHNICVIKRINFTSKWVFAMLKTINQWLKSIVKS